MKAIQISIFCLLFIVSNHANGYAQEEAKSYSAKLLKVMNFDVDNNAVTSISTINSSMIDALKKKEKDTNLLAFLNELTFLRIISIKNTANYCNEAIEIVKKMEKYEEILNLQEKQQHIIIAAIDKTAENKAKEIVLINCDTNSLTIVDLMGNISIGTLGDLSSSIQKAMKNIKK